MTTLEPIDIGLIIAGIVLVFALSVLALRIALKANFVSRWSCGLLVILGIIFIIYLIRNLHGIKPVDWSQLLLVLGLVAVTGLLGLYAAGQARASMKMAEEMSDTRYDTVRPVIDIQREPRDEDKLPEAVAGKSGDTSRGLVCVLRNIGLGPAIDMHSFVQNPFVQNPSDRRQRFEFGTLAAGEKSVLTMSLSLEQEDSRIALVVYCKDVYGRTFESSREVRPDEEKSWQVSPLQIRLIEESNPI